MRSKPQTGGILREKKGGGTPKGKISLISSDTEGQSPLITWMRGAFCETFGRQKKNKGKD